MTALTTPETTAPVLPPALLLLLLLPSLLVMPLMRMYPHPLLLLEKPLTHKLLVPEVSSSLSPSPLKLLPLLKLPLLLPTTVPVPALS